MPKKRISTKTSRQKAAAKLNLAKARKAAANARSANAHGNSKAAGYSMAKSSLFRAKAAGVKPSGKTIEPKAHTREPARKANVASGPKSIFPAQTAGQKGKLVSPLKRKKTRNAAYRPN